MNQFVPLRVTAVRKTIRDAVEVTLTPPPEADFSFTEGQYLTFRRDFDGQELRRSYSICAGREEGVLQVGIKRVSGGAFSTWANTELQIGDTLHALPPMGNFYAKAQPFIHRTRVCKIRHYLLCGLFLDIPPHAQFDLDQYSLLWIW